MTLSVKTYLPRTGAIELLCEVDPEGSQFEELLSELSVSRPTLSKRIAEAKEISLLEPQPITGQQGTGHTYVFTPKGATLRNLLFKKGLVLKYEQYKQARKEFDVSREMFQDDLEDNPPNLSNPEIAEENMHSLLQRNALSDMLEE